MIPVALMLAAIGLILKSSVQADTFGSGGNTFAIDFANIGSAGNAPDTTGYGAVPYEYRIGINEISQDQIDRATASGMANVTAGIWTGNKPAAYISWYEAAAFVNWLNTSTGKQAAYNLTFSGSWSMSLWSSADAWKLGGENLYRHKEAFYFLPSENEWYKAAYYNSSGTNYFDYPTGSDLAPIAVTSGTDAGTAVYDYPMINDVAGTDVAGGLSPYGTMAQGGNVWEWNETAWSGVNSSSSDERAIRGADRGANEFWLRSSTRPGGGLDPALEAVNVGFRVASVPEPSTYALLLMTGAGALWMARRRR